MEEGCAYGSEEGVNQFVSSSIECECVNVHVCVWERQEAGRD